jgi:hypothetical protein
MLYRAVGSVLAGVSWTSAPSEPYIYSLVGNLKKSVAGMIIMIPTPVFVILFVVCLIALLIDLVWASMALASGQVSFDIFKKVASSLLWLVLSGAVLVIKRRARRSAE